PLLPHWTARRRAIAAAYRRSLTGACPEGSRGVTPLTERDGGHVYHLFVVRSSERAALQTHLRASGIETLIHYPVPLPQQPAFGEFQRTECPAAERAARDILSLPLHPRLTDAQVGRIGSAVDEFQKGRILA